MWLLGFSTSNPRTLWIIGAIALVVVVSIMLRRWAVYAEDQGRAKLCCNNNVRDAKIITTSSGRGVIRTYGLEEVRRATKDFRIQIGVGGTSNVYLAELGDGRYGAVKRVMEERGGSRKMFLDEVSVLLRICHPNLVGLIGFCLEKGEQLLLVEYVPNKSLFDRLHTTSTGTFHAENAPPLDRLSWSNRLNIALDVARALDYLHSHADPPIIHRDVKSSNILLVDSDHAKLADFGLCKLGHHHQPAHSRVVKGSLGYVDPHYLKTGLACVKSDVYSFGVVLLELITGLRSLQGSFTLPEWTHQWRTHDDLNLNLVDPKLQPQIESNLHYERQLGVLIDVANSALLDDPQARPHMSYILQCISTCIHSDTNDLLPPPPDKLNSHGTGSPKSPSLSPV